MSKSLQSTVESTAIETIDNNDDLTRAQLESLVDETLNDQEARLWRLMHGNEVGRTHLSTLVHRCFPEAVSNKDCSEIAKRVIGKMARHGISRARAFRIMTGFTEDKVAETLAKLMDSDDEKIRAKVADTSARCLGMIKSGQNVNVNNTNAIQLNARVIQMTDDDDRGTIDD